VEKLEKLVAKARSTVSGDRLTFHVGSSVFLICEEKPHMAFLEVVEGD
jgi:hypothetical protein